jgi:hypothetical protein
MTDIHNIYLLQLTLEDIFDEWSSCAGQPMGYNGGHKAVPLLLKNFI